MPIRRTKIVATLGPATSNPRSVAALVRAGIDVARINASHGTAEQRAAQDFYQPLFAFGPPRLVRIGAEIIF